MTIVSTVKVDEQPSTKQFEEKITELLQPFGGLKEFVFDGAKVLIKPHIDDGANPDLSTNPILVKVLIEMLKQAGVNEIVVGDSIFDKFNGYEIEDVFIQTGYYNMARDTEVELIDFSKEKSVSVPVPQPLQLDTISITKPALAADIIINMPKLNAPDFLPFSLGMANLVGLVSDKEKKRFQKTNFQRSIVDLNQVIKPQLTIVDGIISNNIRNKTKHEESEIINKLLAGTDVVAVDAVTCLSCNISPEKVDYLVWAAHYGFGQLAKDEVKLIGADLKDITEPLLPLENETKLFKEEFPGFEIISCETCPSCLAIIRKAFLKLKMRGLLDKWENKLALACGPEYDSALIDQTDKKVLYLGNCSIEHKLVNEISGCPFFEEDLIKWFEKHQPKS